VLLDPGALFDVQVKRIHEYKRQLLAALHAIHLYLRVVEDGDALEHPRACLFAGKAAPEYFLAKQVIRLLCAISRAVESEPRAREQLRVVFVPDYRVSLAEVIIPGADLSEQISTAGFEASGTGNMKLALGGALTIGTLDGANIRSASAWARGFFLFGLPPRRSRRCARGATTRGAVAHGRSRAWSTLRSTGSRPGAPTLRALLDTLRRSYRAGRFRRAETRRPASRATGSIHRTGRAARRSTSRAWATSRATARFASTRPRSGA
jgi:starch phosphorylase